MKRSNFSLSFFALIGMISIALAGCNKKPAVASPSTDTTAKPTSTSHQMPASEKPPVAKAPEALPSSPKVSPPAAVQATPPGVPQKETVELKQLEENLKNLVAAQNAKEREKLTISADPSKSQALDVEIDSLRRQRRALQEQMRVLVMQGLKKS